MWVILRRLSPNALKLAAANADDRHPNFIVKLRITLHHNGARHSLAKAAFPAAGQQDDNSGKAQRTLQPIHSGAKYEDHEIAPEVTGHGLPLSKREAYNRVHDQHCGSS